MAIICGYAGTGKSYFANKIPDTTEILSMPYAWVLPKEIYKTELDIEKDKGAYYQHIKRPGYPMNIILDILKAEKLYKNIVIPTIERVIEILSKKYGKECILVYPKVELKGEYRQKYIARGNNDSFLELFVDNMEKRVAGLRKLNGKHIELSDGQFLCDALAEIELFNETDSTTLVAEDIIDEIEVNLKVANYRFGIGAIWNKR